MEVGKLSNIRYIRKEGGSKVLAIGHLLPEDWKVVECNKIEQKRGIVIIEVKKVK